MPKLVNGFGQQARDRVIVRIAHTCGSEMFTIYRHVVAIGIAELDSVGRSDMALRLQGVPWVEVICPTTP